MARQANSDSTKPPQEGSLPSEVKQPNVRFSSNQEQFGDPPKQVRIGMLKIELPDAETQRKGFYSEHAGLLINNVPGYKRFISKGEKSS